MGVSVNLRGPGLLNYVVIEGTYHIDDWQPWNVHILTVNNSEFSVNRISSAGGKGKRINSVILNGDHAWSLSDYNWRN